MNLWRKLTLDGVAALTVPEGTSAKLGEDDTMIVLTLPAEPPTDILLGIFPLDRDIVSDTSVRASLANFNDRCQRPVATVRGVSIEPAADVSDSSICAWQSVAKIDGGDRWWLARIYGRRGGAEILLVHWNGPVAQMTAVVTPAMASIELLFA